MKAKFSRAEYRMGKARAQYMRRRTQSSKPPLSHVRRLKKNKLANSGKLSASQPTAASKQHPPAATGGDLIDFISSLKTQQTSMEKLRTAMADSVRTYDAIANIRRIDLAQLRSHIVDNESKFDDFVRVASAHQKGLRQRFDIDSLNINHLRVHEWLDTFPNSHPSLWSWTRSQSPDGTPGTSTSPLAPLDAASIVSSFSTSMISDGPIWSPPTLDPNAVPDSDNDILLILRQKYQQYQQYEQADPTFPPHHGSTPPGAPAFGYQPHPGFENQPRAGLQAPIVQAPVPTSLQAPNLNQRAPVLQQRDQRQSAVPPPQQNPHTAQVGQLQQQCALPSSQQDFHHVYAGQTQHQLIHPEASFTPKNALRPLSTSQNPNQPRFDTVNQHQTPGTLPHQSTLEPFDNRHLQTPQQPPPGYRPPGDPEPGQLHQLQPSTDVPSQRSTRDHRQLSRISTNALTTPPPPPPPPHPTPQQHVSPFHRGPRRILDTPPLSAEEKAILTRRRPPGHTADA